MGWDLEPGTYISPTDLRNLVESLPDAVLVADRRGVLQYLNPAARVLFGESLLGKTLPFTPKEQRYHLLQDGQPLELELSWSQSSWEGNRGWMVSARPAVTPVRQAPSDLEHRAVQSELRCEQLQEQVQRLRDQLGASDDLRHEQQILLGQRQTELQEAQNLLDQQVLRGRQLEERHAALQHRLAQLEESDTRLREQLKHSSGSSEAEVVRLQRQLAELQEKYQALESDLAVRPGAGPPGGPAWDDLQAYARQMREQATRAEERVAQLEQRLFDQEQRARDSQERSESLAARLNQAEQQAEQVKLGLEQRIEHLSLEEQEAKKLAFEDQLTRLPNYNILQQYLEYTVGLVQRNEGAAVLLLLDIDRLRSINSTLSVAAGDDLLRQFASRLKSLCRSTDVLGRRSEDEFLIVVAHKSTDPRELGLAKTTVQQMAQSLASKILNSLQDSFLLEGTPVHISCSMGITMFGEESLEQVLEQAQVALDRARELGRSRFQFFSPDLHDRMRRRQSVVPRLTEALERQEFILLYQPIVDLKSGKMVGIESLLRWDDPKTGLISPADFLPAAESSGLIVPIGEWAVQEACLMAAQFRDLQFVSVNLSPRQLMHGDFPRRFMKAIEKARVRPEKLVVEISEATSTADPERVSQVLAELARWNVGLAIDDFGTGSSSLQRLQREKPRFLKIDNAFVNQLPDDKTSFHIVLAACHLAASLQMQSLAEGVEKEAQLQTLKRMGCQLAQGRLLSHPVGAAQLKELMRKTWKIPGS